MRRGQTDNLLLEAPLYDIMDANGWREGFTLPAGVGLVLYSGYPGSPLNGGRSNGGVDNTEIPIRNANRTTPLTRDQQQRLADIRQDYISRVFKANSLGVPVQLAYTNYFLLEKALEDEESARPIQALIESGHASGVKNDILVANPGIEAWSRKLAGERLSFVLSCSAFFRNDGIVPRDKRIQAYHEAACRYDKVVLTPADSILKEQLVRIRRETLPRMVGLVNSPCREECNSFAHYAVHSAWNILQYDPGNREYLSMYSNCLLRLEAMRTVGCAGTRINIRRRVRVLLSCGVKMLKLGREEPKHAKRTHKRLNTLATAMAKHSPAR